MSESILTDRQRAAIRADVLALPPLTDEQLDAIADVLIGIRLRRIRGDLADAT